MIEDKKPLDHKECNSHYFYKTGKDGYEKDDVIKALAGVIKDCKKFRYWEHAEGLFDKFRKHFGEKLFSLSDIKSNTSMDGKNGN